MSGSRDNGLPATDLSGAFARPSRAEGLRMPPKRATKTRKAVQAVPDPAPEPAADQPETPGPDQAVEKSQTGGTGETPVARRPRRTTSPAAPSAQPRGDAAGRSRRGRPPKVVDAAATSPGQLVLWTPVAIRARMQAVRTATGTHYLDQVLDAIESTLDELPELVDQATRPTQVRGRVFERSAPASNTETGQRVQLTIRGVLASQLGAIDELVATTGAPSRSALVNAALDATLPT